MYSWVMTSQEKKFCLTGVYTEKQPQSYKPKKESVQHRHTTDVYLLTREHVPKSK